MARLRAILLPLLLLLSGQAISQSYYFENFNMDHGLAQSYIYSIAQDPKGYLWIGTGNGLSRYDGFSFKNYTTSDSLAENFITSSISDGEALWLGHMNGGLTYFDGENFKKVNLSTTEPSSIIAFGRSPDGQIWVGTSSEGLIKLDKDQGVTRQYKFSEQQLISSFCFTDTSKLLVGTNMGLLYCKLDKQGKITIIKEFDEISESRVTSIKKKRNGAGFYIATLAEGVYELTLKGQPKIMPLKSSQKEGIEGIQTLLEDGQGNLWLATFQNGLVKLPRLKQEGFLPAVYFNKTTGFSSDNAKTLFEDRDGNIWSGNYGEGLSKITPKIFHLYTLGKTTDKNDVFSLFADKEYIWAGVKNGLVKIDRTNGKMLKFYGKKQGLPKDEVTAVFSEGKYLWAGTEANGVYRLDKKKGKAQKFKLGKGKLEKAITAIIGKGRQLWIGTKKGLCNINIGKPQEKTWYTISQGLPHNFVNYLYFDNSEKLWISTRSNKLAYIKDGELLTLPLNTTAASGMFGPITEDGHSKIWAGSSGNGIYMLEKDSVANLTVKDGLLSDYCYSLIFDEQKNIWVGHKEGLSRISLPNLLIKPIRPSLDMNESYQLRPGAVIRDEQKLWFGTNMGIIIYNPELEYRQQKPPVLNIVSVEINNEKWAGGKEIVLPPGDYKIKINYLGISLKEPELVSYQYKLEGYEEWSEITRDKSVTYNHLEDGEYLFKLKASSGDGAVSKEPLTLRIVIKKPIWKKLWFYPAIVLCFIVLTFIYIKRREYKFKEEKRVLEKKVVERTVEIQNQKNEIETQRDMIDKKNEHITSSIRYASRIQHAIFPPTDLVDQLLPKNFILNMPKDIVSGDFYWITEKNGKTVIAVADCTGHGVPGAFMSLLGITLLNEIVANEGVTESDVIVNKLRSRIVHSLQQSRKDITTPDGMDIILCVLDKQQKMIQYTGGMNNLLYVRNRELKVVKADRKSVSAIYSESDPFGMKKISYQEGDIFYLLSDGYQDQFGGEKKKKYMISQLRQDLLEIHALPLTEQKEILSENIKNWMRGHEQTDDIMVMGFRL